MEVRVRGRVHPEIAIEGKARMSRDDGETRKPGADRAKVTPSAEAEVNHDRQSKLLRAGENGCEDIRSIVVPMRVKLDSDHAGRRAPSFDLFERASLSGALGLTA